MTPSPETDHSIKSSRHHRAVRLVSTSRPSLSLGDKLRRSLMLRSLSLFFPKVNRWWLSPRVFFHFLGIYPCHSGQLRMVRFASKRSVVLSTVLQLRMSLALLQICEVAKFGQKHTNMMKATEMFLTRTYRKQHVIWSWQQIYHLAQFLNISANRGQNHAFVPPR